MTDRNPPVRTLRGVSFRRARAALVAGLVVVVVLSWASPPVSEAHTSVRASDPTPGSSVRTGLQVVTLDFLDPVAPTPTVVVTGPDGEVVDGLGDAELVSPTRVEVRFDPLGTRGDHAVFYEFVAEDGAVQDGSFRFTVVSGPGTPPGLLVALGVGVVIAATVTVRWVRERRTARS